jgi:hypothetical protein
MKLPKWFWYGLVLLCLIHWSVGLWIELLTITARDAFLVIVLFSFIIYPIFTIVSFSSFRSNKELTRADKRLGVILLSLGFITDPAVFQVFKQIF